MSADNSDRHTGPNTGDTTSSGGSSSDIMDTAAFIALNSAYLTGDASGADNSASDSWSSSSSTYEPLSSASKTQSTQTSQTPASGPINPLVAAREAGTAPVYAPQSQQAQSQSAATTRPATKTQADLYPVAEQAATKEIDISFNERKHHGHVARTIIIIILIIAIIVCAAYFILQRYERDTVNTNIQNAWASLAEADTVITPLSQAISNELTQSTVDENLSNSMLSSQVASNALNSAYDQIQTDALADIMMSSEQKTVSNAVSSSIAARQQIVTIGREFLLNDSSASKALSSLNDAYASIADANNQYQISYDQSVAYLNAGDGDDISAIGQAILDADNAAVTDITNAQASVASAKESYPDADYTTLDTYLADALNAYNLLVTYDTSFVGGDTATADAMLDQYNAALATAQQSATAIPADGAALIASAYSDAISGSENTYNDAIELLNNNDAIVQDYLDANGLQAVSATTSDEISSTETVVSSAIDAAQASNASSSSLDMGA